MQNKNFYYRPSAHQQAYTPEALYYNGCGHCGRPAYGNVGELETLQAELANVRELLRNVQDDENRLVLEAEKKQLEDKIETIQNVSFRRSGVNVLSYLSAIAAGFYAFHKSDCLVVTTLSAYGAYQGTQLLTPKEQ